MSGKINRRDFIVISSAAVGTGSALLSNSGQAITNHVLGNVERSVASDDSATTPTFCEICFWKCAGTVHKDKSGEPWKIIGHPDDLHCNGRLCTRGSAGVGAYTDQDRLKKPLLRVGKRGEQTFKEVSWDKALQHIADKMASIKKEHGAEKAALFTHGIGGGFFKTIFKAYGSKMLTHPSYAQCRGPRAEAFKLTFGEAVGSPERTDMENSKCIVLMGSHIGENLHNAQVQTFSKALESGCQVITVDPRYSVAASKSKHWLPIKPGTDMALVLAWINVIIEEGLFDKKFVKESCLGFDELKEETKDKTPEWAYLITGIEPQVIRETARTMARFAPATCVHPSRHVAWYGDDTQRLRSIAILNALLGNWGQPGGFYFQSKAKVKKYPHPAYPKVKKRWYDLMNGEFPLASSAPSSTIRDLTRDGHFKAWMVYATNLMQSLPEQKKTIEAINNLDLLVVIDTMPAEITGYADVVLPECSYLERYDELRITSGKRKQIALRAPAVPPKWDSKPAWWIAKKLADKMGLNEYFKWNTIEEYLDYRLQSVGSSLKELQKKGVIELDHPAPLYFQKGERPVFNTASGKVELYSKRLEDLGFDPLPKFTMPEQPPQDFYRLIYGRAPAHTFGKTVNNPVLNQIMPENEAWINSNVAKQWNLQNGQSIKLKNSDGVISENIKVKVTERIRNDAIYMVHGFGHTDRRLRLAFGKGADDQQLITRVKVDPIMGATGFRTNFVTIVV
ncbi:MAG: molybdopterin-dependent oxidoreductase [Bdellovibrionales bacterium]|jgi:thiosulfate reductase / polysulfide reductase chain A|nr:molybdopterin-dependent oxidoreductase [Bdellovibrionales bacterium]MBT3525534.1 molybdopterin-dependent oxidoreductase [Bdellovibrionales bacterium]